MLYFFSWLSYFHNYRWYNGRVRHYSEIFEMYVLPTNLKTLKIWKHQNESQLPNSLTSLKMMEWGQSIPIFPSSITTLSILSLDNFVHFIPNHLIELKVGRFYDRHGIAMNKWPSSLRILKVGIENGIPQVNKKMGYWNKDKQFYWTLYLEKDWKLYF